MKNELTSPQNNRDIRASLAIINDSSTALHLRLKALKKEYETFTDPSARVSQSEVAANLMQLDAECGFLVARLCTTVDTLKSGLARYQDFSDLDESGSAD